MGKDQPVKIEVGPTARQLSEDPESPVDGAFVETPELAEWVPPPWPDDCPDVGLHHEIPFDEYLKIPAINATALKAGRKSAKHMKSALDGHAGDDTRDRKLGRAFHKRLLEPEAYRTTYQLATPCRHVMGPNAARPGEECGNQSKLCDPATGQWYCGIRGHSPSGAEAPEEWISEADGERVERMAAAVKTHEISGMLHGYGGCEVTIIFDWDGVPFKCRLDKLTEKQPECPITVIDLKKMPAGGGSEEMLQTTCRKWGYDVQMWLYMRAVEAITGEWPQGVLVFVEDGEPYDVVPKWISQPLWQVGRAKAQKAWDTSAYDAKDRSGYKWCIQSGRFPGRCEQIEELYPADWEMKDYGFR
jgi:hypothetical protein